MLVLPKLHCAGPPPPHESTLLNALRYIWVESWFFGFFTTLCFFLVSGTNHA